MKIFNEPSSTHLVLLQPTALLIVRCAGCSLDSQGTLRPDSSLKSLRADLKRSISVLFAVYLLFVLAVQVENLLTSALISLVFVSSVLEH